ncbi:MAG: hypothetical protein AB7R89_22295 [Dehalococcoidia bacterium]
MASKVTPPPDRFGIRRTDEPDRLMPAVAVPLPTETDHTPETPLPPLEPDPAPVAPAEQPVQRLLY